MSLSNRDHDRIMRDYEELRRMHRLALEAREEAIFKAHPEILENRKALAVNAAERAKAAVFHDQDLMLQLGDERENLLDEQAELYARADVTEKDFEITHSCPLCLDTGYVDGKKCRCFLRRERELLYANSHLETVLEEENFNALRTDFYDRTSRPGERSQYEKMLEIIETCRSFAENFDLESRNLLFYGQTGVGKTFLSNCIAKELLDSGHSVLYFSAISLFELFSGRLSRLEEEAPEKGLSELYTADLVIIDDLGTELKNSYTTGQLFHLINERLLAKKSTIISTNLSLSAIADQYTERTASRIFSHYEAILLTGEDLRLKLRKAGLEG